MKKSIAIILCIIFAVSLVACGSGSVETNEFTPVSDGAVIGEGGTTFPLTIVDKEGNAIHITVNTDKEVLGEALQELGIVEGSEGEYGLYITHVNGIAAIYEEDGTYWAFYINDEYAMTGLDQTPIAPGESYKLEATKG